MFRCTDNSVEEKAIEKRKKPRDKRGPAGPAAGEPEEPEQSELLSMVRYGAEKIFDGAQGSSTDEDIETIIAKGEDDEAAQREDGRVHGQGFELRDGRRVAVRFARRTRRSRKPSRAST